MWGIKTSLFNRQFNWLRSAQQKYARRCNTEKMTHVSLEMHAAGYGRAAYDYLSTIMVEDKFPNGANYLWNHQQVLKNWKKMSSTQQADEIAQMCYNLTNIKSDRHPAYLARVALKLVSDDSESDKPELELAGMAESIIIRIAKKGEIPTAEDYTEEQGLRKLKSLVFDKLPRCQSNTALFDHFCKNWVKQAKSTARLHIYNLIGRMFHKYESKKQFACIRAPELKKVELDDFVFDKHTTEGKKRKRGLEHFLREGAKIENPSTGFENRGAVKRKAEQIYLKSEKDYGTRNANSRFERKRLRASFNSLKIIYDEEIVSTTACQKPCGSKPKTVYVKTAAGKEWFVKGPYKDTKSIEFQATIDSQKEACNIIPMGIKIMKQGRLYYLTAPAKKGFENMSPGKLYNDKILWNLVKVLIFRAAFNVSDTNLRNVMVNFNTNEVLSVDEMTPNRMPPRGKRLVDYLFNKPPRKVFCDQVMGIIRMKKDEFNVECAKYGEVAKHLVC